MVMRPQATSVGGLKLLVYEALSYDPQSKHSCREIRYRKKSFTCYFFLFQGEMPSPLLNLAAESGYCEFVTVLIDEGKVEVDTLGTEDFFFC
jgi:hypothetical protein